jgi:hypothetical protein
MLPPPLPSAAAAAATTITTAAAAAAAATNARRHRRRYCRACWSRWWAAATPLRRATSWIALFRYMSALSACIVYASCAHYLFVAGSTYSIQLVVYNSARYACRSVWYEAGGGLPRHHGARLPHGLPHTGEHTLHVHVCFIHIQLVVNCIHPHTVSTVLQHYTCMCTYSNTTLYFEVYVYF